MLRKLSKVFLIVAGFGLLVLFAIAAALSVERKTETELPAPTGPLAVGRAIYDWRDSSHEVLAWGLAPAGADPAGVAGAYMPDQMRGLYTLPAAPIRWVTRDLSKVHAHGIANARMPND